MLPFEQSRHFGTFSADTNSPDGNLEFPDEESFNNWLKSENEIIELNFHCMRSAPNSLSKLPEESIGIPSKRGRSITVEWTKYFTCSFGGTHRACSEGSAQRTTLKPTRKVGCLAKIKFQKLFSSDTIYVTRLNSHSGHSINEIQTWTLSRMSPAPRDWLEKAVAIGMEWKDLKRMTRNEIERADFLGGGNERNFAPSVLPGIMRIKNQDFYNFRRKLLTQTAQLHPDCRKSLSNYVHMISQAGGFSILQDVQEDNVNNSETFFFAFISSWQVEIMLRYNSILLLDATHNTCISLGDRSRKAFLYTILVKHDAAGCGIPVAFMVTNSETQYPLVRWLNWLREKYLVPISPKFMIDCSATEMAAIESSFESQRIRLCHWHMLRSIRTQVNTKIKISASNEEISTAQTRKSAVQDFVGLIHSKTTAEFGQIWTDYEEKYRHHEEWLRYLKANWLKYPEKWWSGNRNGMLEINTNNYIETWHNTLKSGYLGSFRKQRTDILIHLLLREVLPDFRIKVARVTLGLVRRRLSDAEKTQYQKCTELSPETAASLARYSVIEVGEARYSEVIMVKSFTNDDHEYVVSLDQVSTISCCSCSYMTYSKTVCKHMFLSQIVFGYSISYDTRLSKTANFSETSQPEPTAKPSTETETTLKSDEHVKALYLERSGFANSLANGSSPLNNDEREAFNHINAYLARIKRCRDSNDRSWSKRQRR